MAYLLILPICLYTALAMFVLSRHPRTISNDLVATYTLVAALVTAGYLILGTTPNRELARVMAVGVVVVSGIEYLLLPPLVLISLYYESWFQKHQRRLLAAGLVTVLAMEAVYHGLRPDDVPLVYPVTRSAWIHWAIGIAVLHWPVGLALLFASQAVFIATIAFTLYRRLMRWGVAVGLTLIALSGVGISILSPLAGAKALVTVAALNYVPPVVLISVLFIRTSRRVALDTLIRTTLRSYNDGIIILDNNRQVVWSNLQAMRWLATREINTLVRPHILDLLSETPLLHTVRHLLDSGQMAGECEVVRDDEEFVLRAEIQPLTNVRHLPGAMLLVLRDITASRVRQDLHERSRELLALSAISADIASTLERDQVIARALQQISAITRASAAMVYLRDDHEPSLLHLTGKRLAAEGIVVLPERFQVNFSDRESPIAQALRTRSPVIVPDADQSEAYGRRLRNFGVQAGALVPLMPRERNIGLLMVVYTDPHSFTQLEIVLLESVARQLAVAIDNARLHEQERRQRRIAEVLRKAASTLGSMPQDESLRVMLGLLGEILSYDRATVLLVSGPGKMRVGAHAGFEEDQDGESIKNIQIEIESYAYLKRMFDERAPQLVSNTAVAPGWKPGQYISGSWIGAPLIVHDRVLGCLSISHRQPGCFTLDDLHIASAFAAQAAITAENARLFETEQRLRVQAELIQQATYDLVTSPDLESALLAALDNLSKILSFDHANIGLIGDDRQTWVYRVGLPLVSDTESHSAIPMDYYPSIQQVMDTKRPLLIADTHQSELWQPGKFSPQEIRCWIGVPLMARERVIGILNIDSFQPDTFTEEHVQITRVFANQIAAALENFRLFTETSRQNRALSALNTVLASSNEALAHENLSLVLLERVLEALGLSEGVIHQYDPSAHELRLRAAAGLPESVIERLQRVPVRAALPDVVLPPVTVGQTYTFFSAPLTAHGVEIGLLSIRQQVDMPVSDDLKHLLINIGQQVGVVMDNATLFEEATRRAALSTDLGRLSLAIGAQLDRDAVLDLLCRESIGVFDVQGAYVWLIENDRLVGKVAYGTGAAQFVGHVIDLDDITLLPARVIREWRPRYINHAADNPALPLDLMDSSQVRSVLAVPLLKAHVPIGTLMLVNTETSDAFADWLADQVGLLGVQAALAIQNATLFDEVRRRLDQLRLVNETGRYATAILNPQDLVDGVARKLSATLHYDIISLVQPEDGDLSIRSVFVHDQPCLIEEVPALHSPLRELARQAVERAEPVLGDQSGLIEPIENEIPSEHCALAVPLIVADEVSGVLIVARRGYGSITEGDLDVLEPLAAQLAISFQNARLFETVRQQALELEVRVAQRTEEIRQQQERTEAILRSVADVVIVFDLQGRVMMTNPAARSLFDRHDLDMDLGTRVGELVARVLSSGPDVRDTTEIIEVGAVTVQAKAARVVEGTEVLGSVVVLRDISRLQELDRLKDQFVSNVSHELRTPLANIKLYLSLLEQGRPERRANYYEVMSREIQRLTRLINDLLQISRLASEQREERPRIRQPLALDSMINTVIHDNMAWAESEHKELLHECLSPPLPRTYGDPDQIVRALTNLVSNAISYTPDGGRIAVRSQIVPLGQTKPEWVIIEVIDTGIGIPADDLPSIFDRFYRGSNVSPSIPGTGLGLAIIRDIVRLHGGSIEVESKEGQGSTFRLRLPVLDS
jgi:GAF domain-containing protein/signal transduction histidine kinase